MKGARGARDHKERDQEQSVEHERHAAPLRLPSLCVARTTLVLTQFARQPIALRSQVAQSRVAVATARAPIQRLQNRIYSTHAELRTTYRVS